MNKEKKHLTSKFFFNIKRWIFKKKYLTSKDFSFQFDTISLGTESKKENDPDYHFLSILSNVHLSESQEDNLYEIVDKVKFVFPMFYNFALSSDKKNVDLFAEKDKEYVWLIDESIVSAVEEHSKYGMGITQSYCKSEISPSYIKMKRSDSTNEEIAVKLVYYEDIDVSSARLKLQEKNELVKRCISETRNKNHQTGINEINKIRIVRDDIEGYPCIDIENLENLEKLQYEEEKKLFANPDFINGLKSHWPILKDGTKTLYYFFTNNLRLEESIWKGFGGVFVITEGELDEEEIGFFILAGYALANKVALNQEKKLARKEAIRSAKAAIMSRNMSHNLGSHVMFYIKQQLQSVEKIFETDTLAELVKSNGAYDHIINNNVTAGDKNPEMPFLVGLGRFLNYLQERQDFIATMATNYIPYKTTINFKDAIYDELKPEKHSIRHSKKGKEYNNQNDVGQKAANLLLKYIVKSEGYDSSDDIDLFFGYDFWGEGFVPYELRKFNISLPGGNLGRQAFFSIMENIIRNTAKHGGGKDSNEKLGFQLDILSAQSIPSVDSYSPRKGQIIVDDKLPDMDTKCYERFKDDLYYLGITVRVKQNDVGTTLKNIGKGLIRPYLTDKGYMDDECKGIKEMRISAAWMRGYEMDTEIPADEPPAIAIRDYTLIEEKNMVNQPHYIQYIIGIPKPKRVAIVSSSLLDKEEYHTNGYKVFNPKEGKDVINRISEYDLVVYHGNETDDNYKKIRQVSGSRIFSDTELEKKWKEDDIQSLYRSWLDNTFPSLQTDSHCTKLSIIDFQAAKKYVDNKKEVSSEKEILLTPASSQDNAEYYSNNIVYNTHYKGQALVEENAELFAKARFVESISGGNSTDRLIRHDERGVEWYCKMLAAGLTKVAVFDERLYSLIVPQKGQNLKNIIATLDPLFKERTECSIDDILDDYLPTLNLSDKELDNVFMKLGSVKNVNVPQDRLYEELKKLGDCFTVEDCKKALSFIVKDYSKTWQYLEKGVWVFNIRINESESEDGKGIEIIGYNAVQKENEIGVFDPLYHEEVLAYITKDKSTGEVIIESDNSPFYGMFDFISIHQGLLDKIYGKLGIGGDDIDGRENTTKAIFDAFSKFGSYIEKVDNVEKRNNKKEAAMEIEYKDEKGVDHKGYFLPQFVIHSGRSKPNKKDMPQHLPFLQFSAIDHAIRDCKYMLTELLYSAHYEQN